jgi:hypothetical protein
METKIEEARKDGTAETITTETNTGTVTVGKGRVLSREYLRREAPRDQDNKEEKFENASIVVDIVAEAADAGLLDVALEILGNIGEEAGELLSGIGDIFSD